jgi:hypothetical protein
MSSDQLPEPTESSGDSLRRSRGAIPWVVGLGMCVANLLSLTRSDDGDALRQASAFEGKDRDCKGDLYELVSRQ